MRNSILTGLMYLAALGFSLAVLAAGCGVESAVSPPQDSGSGDLAHVIVRHDLAMDVDLSPPEAPPDLASPAPPDLAGPDDGAAPGCDSGQVLVSGECRLIQTQAECDSKHRQYDPVGLIGYCGDCVTPFQEYFGACALPMCGSSDGTLGALCAQLGRGCDDSSGMPTCAPCGTGSILDSATQACVSTHCDLRSDCPEIAGFYCTQLTASDVPQCRKRPCPAGQSWDRSAGQSCIACGACGGGEWPVTDAQGNCYCTARPGWFYDHSTTVKALQQCDEDGDGWLKESVKVELGRVTANPSRLDYTILFNVQCTIPYFTSVELRNEWQQSLTLHLSDIGQLSTVTGIAMYEDPANDTTGYVTSAVDGSTSVSGSSVNSLTKACSATDLDLNRNGVADVIEDQSTTAMSWAADYQPLTHFMELYHAHFEQSSTPSSVSLCQGCTALPLPGIEGKLVIEERSRCDGDFPMPLTSASTNYWQNCVRRRPDMYQGTDMEAYDFAEYDCGKDTSGACSYPWPATWGQPSPQPAPAPAAPGRNPDGTVPSHGLCDGGVPVTPWMGMTAYSQFQCGHVHDSSKQYNNDVPTSDVYTNTNTGAPWEAMTCRFDSEAPTSGGPGTTASFVCNESLSGAARPVTWLARRYQSYSSEGAYTAGCIDEATEYPQLCSGSTSAATAGPFGQIECGVACPDAESLKDEAGSISVCIHPTLSGLPDGTPFMTTPSPSPHWQLTGEIPLGGIGGTVSGCTGDGLTCWQIQ